MKKIFVLSVLFLSACQQGQNESPRVTLHKPIYPDTIATGQLTASPETCEFAPGATLCSSTISWTTANASDVKVKIGGFLFAAAQSGSQVAPWISETPAEFELWGDGVLLASLTVLGVKPSAGPTGKLVASPTTCTTDPATGLCSSTISWTSKKATDVKVKVNGYLFGAALVGSALAPWISETPANFELWGDGILLDKLTVIGKKDPVVNPPPTPTPTPVPVIPADHCKATDALSLMTCFSGLTTHKYSGIAVMSDITCTGSEACLMFFYNFKGPAKIYGASTSGKNVIIYRKDHFDYPIFRIFASSDIEIKDIDFQEGGINKPAGLFKTAAYDRNLSCDVPQSQCNTTIDMNLDASRIVFDHISILESKSHGIQIGNVNDVTFKNSTIKHAWANGLWTTSGLDPVPNAHVPNNLVIENSIFIDNRCSAIEMSAMGKSVVRGNYLSHNHMGSIYGHPGGQMAVEGRTNGLLVKDNEITNGKIDEDPVLASMGWMTIAFEFTDSYVRNVTLDHNHFHNNTGGGIIHDPNPLGRVDFGPITIINNVINNPMPAFNGFSSGELIEYGNCIGASCIYVK